MLTPAFELSQDAIFLIISIKAPYAKISETEVFIDDCEFKFYSKPYYLRLSLPGSILEDGRESAQYDSSQGSFSIKVPKASPGEHFEGLDMLTKLLAPSGSQNAKPPLIEVLETSLGDVTGNGNEAVPVGADGEAEEEEEEDEEEEEEDWQIEQEPYQEEAVTLNDPKYGFANQRSGIFKRLQAELHNIIDLKDADMVRASDRRKLRIADEETNFDDDYYLADLYQDECVQQVLSYRPDWEDEYKQFKAGDNPENIVDLAEEDKELMRKLPRKEYLLDDKSLQTTLLGLVDIVFGYAYNHRMTEGENTVESSWTVSKLSATLSWLETYTSVHDAVVTSMRRCLCYPLYRHWKLGKRVLRDTQKIFALGRRRLLKCLLEVHRLLIDSDSRYVLNDLYITDYCVWIQSVSSKHLKSLAKKLAEMKVDKVDLGLDLVALEQAAVLALEEDQGRTEELCRGAEQLSVTDQGQHPPGVENATQHGRDSEDSHHETSDKIKELQVKMNMVKVSECHKTTETGKDSSPLVLPGTTQVDGSTSAPPAGQNLTPPPPAGKTGKYSAHIASCCSGESQSETDSSQSESDSDESIENLRCRNDTGPTVQKSTSATVDDSVSPDKQLDTAHRPTVQKSTSATVDDSVSPDKQLDTAHRPTVQKSTSATVDDSVSPDKQLDTAHRPTVQKSTSATVDDSVSPDKQLDTAHGQPSRKVLIEEIVDSPSQ